METKIDFLYLNEQDMIAAGVKDMEKCVKVMEDMMVTLKKGDYVMGGVSCFRSRAVLIEISPLSL